MKIGLIEAIILVTAVYAITRLVIRKLQNKGYDTPDIKRDD